MTRLLTKSMAALALAIIFLPASIGLAGVQKAQTNAALNHSLSAEATSEVQVLTNYFERARSIDLLTANNAVFRSFYLSPGTRSERIKDKELRHGTNQALKYLETLFPSSIGEACFIDRYGPENARVVRGKIAPVGELASDESDNPFFEPTFALHEGEVYQAEPYISPDTREWVISNSTPLPMPDHSAPAIVHFEVTIESFRKTAAEAAGDVDVAIVDADSGRVIIDSEVPQRVDEPLGSPQDRRYVQLARATDASGLMEVGGQRAAYALMTSQRTNANDWFVVVTSRAPLGLLSGIGIGSVGMLFASFLLLGFAAVGFRSSHRELSDAATRDSLTGIGNRRKLMRGLGEHCKRATIHDPSSLILLDLNGFKLYNDRFGHPAGDALLVRLAGKLTKAVGTRGEAYRMGGDEFCVLASVAVDERGQLEHDVVGALADHGEGFTITSSSGSVVIPSEAKEPSEALRIADGRMYSQKQGGRLSAGQQSRDVLLGVLQQRHPDLGLHVGGVAAMVERVAIIMGLPEWDVHGVVQAAHLHDIGKMAIPDAILDKPGPLSEEEWVFMRRHTLIGEKIVSAAPDLTQISKLVRSSHERYDGRGYPDNLAGEKIPIGARIIAVCDSFDAMTGDRPYRRALTTAQAVEELTACAGSQFDPRVVEALLLCERTGAMRTDVS